MSTTVDRFPQIMVLIFDLEGPESDNLTTDPNGGLTKFGISQVQHPDVDVANLTPTTATACTAPICGCRTTAMKCPGRCA